MPRTVILDVNETLSDTAALGDVLAGIGAGAATPTGWLAATLRDGFALSLTTGARPFADVARQALRVLLAAEPDLEGSVDDGVERVMAAFAELPVHADVADGLRALATAGHRVVTLSNGSADYARSLLERAGVADAVDAFLSVDDVGVWKPHRDAYAHALSRTGADAKDCTLVAVHPWDLHGARAAGLGTVHLARASDAWPDVFEEPDLRIRALTELRLS
ncbi:haloacid dehalogenase type II [Clavibacter lycopersici]|uniref:Haloacid dehalogenase type II n=1 Tax=Clavibacter lycopersici TaxID=2301718 RepID=A0A399T9C0_9MICO|nr:haloacid dehalogenase type II [Clavibacter lycopersici]RIJ51684.1 haloacid dehalogenase type II [Clavibacter lycopersici]RIJ61128.1 haloacid dehalogenase type II [Clavibacter lycopersici]